MRRAAYTRPVPSPSRRWVTPVALTVLTVTACGQDEPSSRSTGRSVFGAREQAEKIKQDKLRRELAATRARPTEQPIRSHTGAARAVRAGEGAVAASDRASFSSLERRLGGRSGVAVASRSGTVAIGTWTTGVAWSTMKVPLGVTVERRGSVDAQALRTAITASDNASAERLWSSLGAPPAAARAVERTLAAAGDTATRVQSVRVRSGFTAFGQTRWSLLAAARFAAKLPCLTGAAPVLTLMGEVVPDQRWGLGSTSAAARFKGGWGPDPSGRYEVRQLGLLTVGGKQVAIAIANAPADGAFASGTKNLTGIAQWAVRHVTGGSAKTC